MTAVSDFIEQNVCIFLEASCERLFKARREIIENCHIFWDIGNLDDLQTRVATSEASNSDKVVLIVNRRTNFSKILNLQNTLIKQGKEVLFILVATDSVQFGPIVTPGQIACLSCWETRNYNNERKPNWDSQNSNSNSISLTRPISSTSHNVLSFYLELWVSYLVKPREKINGINDVGIIDLSSNKFTRHNFLNVTECTYCNQFIGPEEKPKDLEFTSQIKEHAHDKRVPNPKLKLNEISKVFFDRRSGIIKHMFQDTTSNLMPLYVAEMQLLDSEAFESGYGRAETIAKSQLIAILEALERYAGHIPRKGQELFRGSYNDMAEKYGSQAIDPEIFILHQDLQYNDKNFELMRYDPKLEFNWIWGYSMQQKRRVLVPEQIVYYRVQDKPDMPVNRFIYTSSNGCSLGGCLEEAVLGGLYEVVERDAYFATWYTRIAPRKILLDSITERKSKALIDRALVDGFEVYLFDLQSDTHIPVIWGMIVDPRNDAPVKSYCAAGCHANWDEAIFAALVEITTSIGVYQKSLVKSRERAVELHHDTSLVQEMFDHVHLFSLPETYSELAFLLKGQSVSLDQCKTEQPWEPNIDLTEELEAEVGKVLGVANDIIVVDQTFPALENFNLSCVKVLVPGLLPVTFGHQYRRIGFERLDKFAKFKNEEHTHFDLSTINHFPHNFP